LLVSSNSLTVYVAVMFFGAPIGSFIDRNNRLRAARLCIGIEKGAVLLALVACCWLLSNTQRAQQEEGGASVVPHDVLSIALIVAVHFFGALAMLFNQGFVVAIERDWIVVLSKQTDVQLTWLSGTNVALRQIHLSCRVLSPTIAGWIVGDASSASNAQQRYCDLHKAAVFVGILFLMSLVVEYVCATRVYRLVPALALPQQPQEDPAERGTDLPQDKDTDAACDSKERCNEFSIGGAEETTEMSSARRSFAIYWEQPIVCAGLSLALTYSNALTFGGAMTTFLLWEGMSVTEVGFWCGVRSAVGLAGTFAYNWSARHTTVFNTGAWSVVYLFVCLTFACGSFFIRDYNISVYLLVASTAASRIGLWVFDISVTLLYQEMAPDGVRGVIGGTQQSINSFFVLASGCRGLFFHRPEQLFCDCHGRLHLYRYGYDPLQLSVQFGLQDISLLPIYFLHLLAPNPSDLQSRLQQSFFLTQIPFVSTQTQFFFARNLHFPFCALHLSLVHLFRSLHFFSWNLHLFCLHFFF